MKIARILAVGILTCASFANAQDGTRQLIISVDGARPLSQALDILMSRHPEVIVTYEDPRYQFREEMRDIANEPGTSFLVPRGGALTVQYLVSAVTGNPVDWESILNDLVTANNSRGLGGDFAVMTDEVAFHVVPLQVRNAQGNLMPASSVLDALISIEEQEINGLDALTRICLEVSRATGERIEVGGIPVDLFAKSNVEVSADVESARRVLMRVLEATGAKLVWRLNYAVSTKSYLLNVLVMALPARVPQEPREIPDGPSIFRVPGNATDR